MDRSQQAEPVIEIAQYVVTGTRRLETANEAIRRATTNRRYARQACPQFRCRGDRVQVWHRGHYYAKAGGNRHADK